METLTIQIIVKNYKNIFSLFCLPGLRPRRVATEVRSCLAVIPDLGAIVVDPPSLKKPQLYSLIHFT